jgi:hypothetical protein
MVSDIDNDRLIAQVNELIEDKMSVETFSEGEYLPSVRQVVQDLHSFGVGVKHIGQTMQTVLKHLVGIEENYLLLILIDFPIFRVLFFKVCHAFICFTFF